MHKFDFCKKKENYYESISSKWLTAASSPSLSSSTSWLHPLMSCDVLWLIVITVRELFDMSRLGNSSWTSAKINQWSYLPLSEIFLITSIQKIFKVFCIQNGDCALHFKSKINCHWLFFLTKIHVTKYRRSPQDLGTVCLFDVCLFVYLVWVSGGRAGPHTPEAPWDWAPTRAGIPHHTTNRNP